MPGAWTGCSVLLIADRMRAVPSATRRATLRQDAVVLRPLVARAAQATPDWCQFMWSEALRENRMRTHQRGGGHSGVSPARRCAGRRVLGPWTPLPHAERSFLAIAM
jgi:hypothetical protein